MDNKVIVEAVPHFSTEDGGCAKIAEVCPNDFADEGIFVRIQSWSEKHNHDTLDKLEGKKVRVTIEVVD